MKRTATLVLSVAFSWSAAAAFAEPPGFAKARGARAKEVLTEVHGRVPEPARASIQRSREAVGEDAGRASEAAREAAEREREHGPGKGRHTVKRGTGASGKAPSEVERRAPEQAKAAIGISREASQPVPRMPAEAAERAHRAPGGPPFGAGHVPRPSSGAESLGRPSFGGQNPISFGNTNVGRPSPGMGPGTGGPPAGVPGGRR